jgi:hypothetical protein
MIYSAYTDDIDLFAVMGCRIGGSDEVAERPISRGSEIPPLTQIF